MTKLKIILIKGLRTRFGAFKYINVLLLFDDFLIKKYLIIKKKNDFKVYGYLYKCSIVVRNHSIANI